MNMWNIKSLDPPPITTYKTKSYAEIQEIRFHFKNALDFFNSQTILDREAALLSRCIYRMKMKFRSDKGLKSMEKLNRVLLQFNYLNIRGILDDFYSLLPKEKNTDLYIPTRNMLDFILVRLQGTAFLMCRAIEVAQEAACSMGSRICIGHSWKVGLIVLGVTSRLWVICRKILRSCSDFYKNLLSIRKILKNISKDWLPDDYMFPDNMEDILKIQFSNFDVKPDFGLFKSIVLVNEIIEKSDVEECDEYFEISGENSTFINLVSDQQLNNGVNNYKKICTFDLLINDEDLGDVVHESMEQIRNIVNISSDSEESLNTTNNISSHNSRIKQGRIDKGNSNSKMKRKKTGKHFENKVKDRFFVNNPELKVEDDHFGKIKMIETERNEQMNVETANKKNLFAQNRCKKKNVIANRDVIENISSLKQLKIFIKNETKCKENKASSSVLGKMDKLQWTMLRKHIKKYIKQANNSLITDSQCLIEAKIALIATLNN